jgi:phage shock protein A
MSERQPDDTNAIDAELVADAPAVPEPDYSESGEPSFDFVRDKIEKRYTTSLGETELAGMGTDNTVENLDKKIADREQAAKDRLAEIRRSMGKE